MALETTVVSHSDENFTHILADEILGNFDRQILTVQRNSNTMIKISSLKPKTCYYFFEEATKAWGKHSEVEGRKEIDDLHIFHDDRITNKEGKPLQPLK